MFRTSSIVTILVAALWYYYNIFQQVDKIAHNLNLELLDRNTFALPEDNVNTDITSDFKPSKVKINSTFEYGIASGDPLIDSIILWTRISPSIDIDNSDGPLIPIDYKVSKDKTFTQIISEGSVYTNKYIDYTIKIDITGLEPNSTYFYKFINEFGIESDIGTTRTLPNDDQSDPLKLAVYSCANYAGGFYHAYKFPTLKQSVDYVIHLGDYIYEYANGEYTNGTDINRDHKPEHECMTLDDYRERYALYRSDKELQNSHSSFPWILVWDDHELTDNSWLRGSVHTKGYDFLKRKDAATQAYFEWLPIRPQKNINKIWRTFKFGKLLQLNMLDTRHYSRDITDYYSNQDFIGLIKDYDDRTILGYDQEEWLQRNLITNDTIWKFIASQCVVRDIDFTLPKTGGLGFPFEEFNQDAWDGYIQNRNRLLNFIKDNKIENTVILSGDFHIAIASELSLPGTEYKVETGEGSVLVEFTTSAVSSPSTFPREFTELQCLEMSKELVDINGLIWNDGFWRGYIEVLITEDHIETEYYGVNVRASQSDEILLAKFTVKEGEAHIDRDSININNGALYHSLHSTK